MQYACNKRGGRALISAEACSENLRDLAAVDLSSLWPEVADRLGELSILFADLGERRVHW